MNGDKEVGEMSKPFALATPMCAQTLHLQEPGHDMLTLGRRVEGAGPQMVLY